MLKRTIKALVRGDLGTLNKQLSRRDLNSFLEKEFSKFQEHDQVLSVGAGGGVNRLLSRYSEQIGFSVVQLDIDESREPDIVADLCGDLSHVRDRFTVVVMAEVLEHLHNPTAALENIFSLLESGGRLVLTVPFLFPIHEEPNDYFRYTRFGLQHLLRGFEEVIVVEGNGYFSCCCVLLVRCGAAKEGRSPGAVQWLSTFLAYLIFPIALLLDRWPRTHGTSRYLVTARRP